MAAGRADFAAAVWEHSASGMLAIDAEGAIALINAAARRVLDVPEEALAPGSPWEPALAHHPALVRLLREALAGRPPLSRAELSLLRPDGAPLTLGFSLTPVPGPSGTLRGVVLLFRDLAPIERSGERVRLQQRLAALGEMAAGLAHELRNPLAGMEVLAGLLERRLAEDSESLELVRELRGQLHRMSETVTASLDFLRPLALRREPFDPVELLEEAVGIALSRAPRPVQIERRYATVLPKLEADRQLLGVALVNLLVNACEAMSALPEAAPQLGLAIDLGPGLELARELRIAVGDNGGGIPDEIRDRIFDPFFTTKESGTGIGLATVQKIAAAHGGSLSLESSGEGSVFRIHLPLAGSDA
jgi:PAS domain S-box-containing protein